MIIHAREGERPREPKYLGQRDSSWGSRGRSPSRRPFFRTASQTELEAVAKGWEKMKPFLEGKTVKQVIVLPKKPVILLAG